MKKKKFFQPLAFAALTLLILGYVFVKAMNLNPLYADGAFFWCSVITLYVLLWCFFRLGGSLGKVLSEPDEHGRIRLNFEGLHFAAFPKAAKLLIAVPWVLFFVMSVLSTVFFNYKAFRDQLGDPQVQAFTSDIQAVDLSQIPIVDKDLAAKLADKKLGERPSLGSQVYLGKPTIQRVDGKLLWAVPLHHSGFFKWITNLSGSAGYITVSATNVNDVEYVEEYKIKYQPYSYFLHDLSRWVRFTSAPMTGIVDYSFELDDSGVPHWVVTTYKNRQFFALPEATGVIVVNATTGDSQRYGIADVPGWVDRVQPEDFVISQIDNQGEYVHGFWNFSDKDKFKSSEGHAIVYNNGRCYLFTGLTSVGSDNSSIGFMMVDMVTKQPLLYQMNGATEQAGQSSAQGKVQHLRYTATFPLIINADGVPTYFMTLKDAEGLIKQYAFVSVPNYSIVGTGETVALAYRNYEVALRQGGGNEDLTGEAGEQKETRGTVLRIASQYDGSRTLYYMVISINTGRIYT
ncbi:MAG: hypothetical protein RRY21_03940, partial [Oscillospiraceae bacterium]